MRRSAALAAARRDTRAATRRWAIAASTLIVLTAAVLHAPPARAAMQAMNDIELADVRGQADTLKPRDAVNALPLAGPLLKLLSPEHLQAATLDQAAFEAALVARGLPPLASPFYSGGGVMQLAIDAPPMDVSFDAAALIPGVGSRYHGASSFGRIDISGLDARGTTLWIWHH